MQTVLAWVATYGYVAISTLLVLGIVGLPVPDETLLVFSGYLVHKGNLKLVPTFLAALFGSICGISISYALGRTFGLSLIHRYGRIFHITDQHIQRVHDWFERMGRWALIVGYYMPGIRHFTAVVAGTSKLEPHIFALFAYSGAVIWVTSFISLGYFLGEGWEQASKAIHRDLLIGTIIIICVLAAYYFLIYRRRQKP